MQLQEHIARVVRRTDAFYRSTTGGHFLINAHAPAKRPALPPLQDFDLDHQLTEWLDHKLAAARPAWRASQGLDNDSIPCICPMFGIAEHSAWLGMDVRFQETTCLPIPMIDTPEDLSRIQLSEQNKWFGYMKAGYEHLRSRQDGDFVTSVRGTMAPMDMANAVRGDELFLDVLQRPDFCHRLLAFLVNAIRWYYSHVYSWADDIEGGRVYSFGGGWMPPKTLGHISNDAAMLCSPQVYREFGFPHDSRLVAGYENVLCHVHNEKLHYVPDLAKLPGLTMLEITPDPKTVPPMEDLTRILAATGSVNLMLPASSENLRKHIDELQDRNVHLLVGCRDRADAEDIIAFVRDRSKPL